MEERRTILIIDDEKSSREELKNITKDARITYHLDDGKEESYIILDCENCDEGRKYLNDGNRVVATVLLDLNSTINEGFQLLMEINHDDNLKDIPVIVITAGNNEKRALELGAWDFIRRPFDSDIIKARIKNTIYRNRISAFKKLKELAQLDSLTKLYNKEKFYEVTTNLIRNNKDKQFVFIRFDIDKLQQFNTFFGANSGDELLKYVSDSLLRKKYGSMRNCTYGKIESDIFGICHEYDESNILDEISSIRDELSKYKVEYDIVPNMGLYVIEDNNLPMSTIYNRANLAADYSKDNYIKFYTFYNEKMGSAFIKEQEIVNEMQSAIDNEQFDVYFQPKYSLATNKPYGAEALVRWFHPKKGMVMPGEFIPVFEKNGFISKLDYYVWEKTCKYIRKWIDEGRNIYPVSVNVSRVNMYNPNIVNMIKELTDQYGIPPQLLNLELTESAYTDDPFSIKEVVAKFREHGFVIMMDDFGSGYSSLNVLKDILVDVLKVDMRFLSKTDIPGRGENILASVIRMAKWLKLPVIVEGVETASQKRFLKSIGCDYVQGFFFARPMPESDYIKLIDDNQSVDGNEIVIDEDIDINYLFEKNPQMEILFGNQLQPIAIFEVDGNEVEFLRVNEAYYNMIGNDDIALMYNEPLKMVDERYRESVLRAFDDVASNKKTSKVEYLRMKNDGTSLWVNMRLQYIHSIANKDVIIGTLNDVTIQKEIDNMLSEIKNSDFGSLKRSETMLIVDDYKLERIMLRDMFKEKYEVVEAASGDDAIKVLTDQKQIDIIVLDLVMPNMDGKELLKLIKSNPDFNDIPVVVITPDDTKQSQTELFSLGVDDYIIKPFIREMVMKRIENVLVSYNNKKLMKRNKDIADKLSVLSK